jgi:hypothetical protein
VCNPEPCARVERAELVGNMFATSKAYYYKRRERKLESFSQYIGLAKMLVVHMLGRENYSSIHKSRRK